MSDQVNKPLEIRGFLKLDSYLRKWFGTKPPYFYDLEEPISGLALSERFEIQREDIEVIFVNGFVESLDYIIQPGDRIAFLPPGCPGPYRIALGFYGKNQGNDAAFKLKKDEQRAYDETEED